MVEKTHRLKLISENNLRTIPIIRRLLLCFISVTLMCFSSISKAQNFISDDETETLLHKIIQPIFKAANIPFIPEKILILNDDTLNAFVTDGNYLVIYTGTITEATSVNELSGILAHEAGHIAGGHIVRQKLELDKMNTISIASLIAAGAAAAASGSGDAAMAVMLGSQSSIFNAMTHYQMQEERSADESAVKYLAKIGQSPQGLKDFMKKSEQKNRLSGYDNFPYFRTHPMDSERINFFNQALKNNHGSTQSAYDDEFLMVQAKITAFLEEVKRGWQKYPLSDTSLAAHYAHAILYYRESNLEKALKTLDNLIAKQPQNPFFYELKGQFLFESGKIKPAVEAYSKAKQLRDSPEISLGWAQAALEMPEHQELLPEIIGSLNKIVVKNYNSTAWLLLARAYHENKQEAYALYASAEYNVGPGNLKAAASQLDKAQKSKPSAELQLKITDLKNFIVKLQKSRGF